MKIENNQEENSFLENLHYQITQNSLFFKRIPLFRKKLDDLDFQIMLKDSNKKLRKYLEIMEHRKIYNS
ncbi:MAG: hypothetical protein ACFFAN_12820 [Promethearchaeota archaeon]